ncbi:unnamed protein product [Kluyveromyces dobzhanskii CBS 2104]|uniref:WGS project CCBQ000000000 data, contig 00104 n=1 Tax=Kluyveromyces dobzhanskii CBS 2104 TaxID=1427455 RepID=A0A0A8L5Z4_9SACH|nr:unnamed protein product [Kluyveromyces dobzhanskii CBS 2104]
MTENSTANKRQKLQKKQIIINAFLMASAGNQTINSWRNENDQTADSFQNPQYWIELAKLLEKGKFNSVFFADVLGPYDVYNGPGNFGPVAKAASQFPLSDPTYFIPLMASVTKNLAFGVTASTIAEPPYHLSRRLGTVDLISNGRVGWNIVTSYLDSASRNLLNGESLPSNVERYDRAEEYLDVVYKLFLSSWQDGAQHLPVLIQAGASTRGKELAARNAEVIFFSSKTKESLAASISDVKEIAKNKFGRDLSKIKFLSLVNVVLGETAEEAQEKYEAAKALGDVEAAKAMFSGWTGVDIGVYDDDQSLDDVNHVAITSAVQKWKEAAPDVKKWTKNAIVDDVLVAGYGPLFVGTAEQVAQKIEDWVEYSDVDGFNFTYTQSPQSFEDIVEYLLPELRKRGLLPEDYPEPLDGKILTYREQLFGDRFLDRTHPAHDLRWNANENKESFESRLPAALERLENGSPKPL